MLLVLAAAAAIAYWLGSRRPVRLLDSRARWGARQWRATSFYAGVLLLLVTVSSPMEDALAASMWTRAIQLMVLVMAVAPLLVVGGLGPRVLRLLPARVAGLALLCWAASPLTAFVLFNGAIWLSYLPWVYRLTANEGWLHDLAQTAILGLAFLFWSQVIDQRPLRCRLSYLGRMAFLLLASAQLRILALVLGFASRPFYPYPLADQQLAAGVLLVPGVLSDTIALIVCAYLWLAQEDRRTRGGHGSAGRGLARLPRGVPA